MARCHDASFTSARLNATVSSAGVFKRPATIDMSLPLFAEINLYWSLAYPTELFEVTELLAEHWRRFEPMISRRIPFERLQQAFDLLTQRPGEVVKASILLGD